MPGLGITWGAYVPDQGLGIGDRTCNVGMCPEWESNWQLFSYRTTLQPTEPQQPGQDYADLNRKTLANPGFLFKWHGPPSGCISLSSADAIGIIWPAILKADSHALTRESDSTGLW